MCPPIFSSAHKNSKVPIASGSSFYLNVILLQPSGVIFPHLQELEKRFFDIVEGGSVSEVRFFLEDNPKFNINVMNFQVSS